MPDQPKKLHPTVKELQTYLQTHTDTTQASVAREIGMDPGQLNRLLCGRSKKPRPNTVKAIRVWLDRDVTNLVGNGIVSINGRKYRATFTPLED